MTSSALTTGTFEGFIKSSDKALVDFYDRTRLAKMDRPGWLGRWREKIGLRMGEHMDTKNRMVMQKVVVNGVLGFCWCYILARVYWYGAGVGFLRYKKDEQQGWKPTDNRPPLSKSPVILLLDSVDGKDPATVDEVVNLPMRCMILSINRNTIVTRNLDGWAEQKGELERALREAGEMAGSGVNIQTHLQMLKETCTQHLCQENVEFSSKFLQVLFNKWCSWNSTKREKSGWHSKFKHQPAAIASGKHVCETSLNETKCKKCILHYIAFLKKQKGSFTGVPSFTSFTLRGQGLWK